MGKRNGCTVIAGCGRLGASIAGKLSEEKKEGNCCIVPVRDGTFGAF